MYLSEIKLYKLNILIKEWHIFIEDWWKYLRILSSERRLWKKPILLDLPYTREVLRCTWISNSDSGLLQSLSIPSWKWEDIHKDFIVGLPRTPKGNDSIWLSSLITTVIRKVWKWPLLKRTPLNWSEPELVTTAEEQVRLIQAKLKTAQTRQQSYADKRRRPLTFEVGNSVYLKVSPMKGVHRFSVAGKLAPRYIGPFPIIEKCGPVAYRLELPPHLSAVHNVFHISQLKKCLRNLIWFIKNVQVKCWIPKKEQPDDELSSSTRFNGRTILRMKLHENPNTSCSLNILSSGERINEAPS
ncbi:hypothetical protein U9M48_031303, partial [Paspalum notatum var. saurae]